MKSKSKRKPKAASAPPLAYTPSYETRTPDQRAAGGNVMRTAALRARLGAIIAPPQVSLSLLSDPVAEATPGQVSITAKRSPARQRTPPGDTPLRADDSSSCKVRPSNTKGKGGSRDFVPYCNRKR